MLIRNVILFAIFTMINGNEKKVSKIKCPDGNLPLEEMFKSQSIPSSLYEWQCGTQFVKIFKSNQSSDKTIMMFVSMFNDVNQSASTYNILDTATSLTFSKRNLLVKYRIVIRFQDGYQPIQGADLYTTMEGLAIHQHIILGTLL